MGRFPTRWRGRAASRRGRFLVRHARSGRLAAPASAAPQRTEPSIGDNRRKFAQAPLASTPYSHTAPQDNAMLTQEQVDKIVEMLAEGRLSNRKIAAQLDVSRGVVCSIANGRRGHYGRQIARQPQQPPGAKRCPECGVRVYLPCVACQARDYRRRRVRPQTHSGVGQSLVRQPKPERQLIGVSAGQCSAADPRLRVA